jgi:hypothetical protein
VEPVEPKQPGFSRWHGEDRARAAVYGNRIRLRSGIGKQAMRRRAEIVERSFAHNLDRGGMRRTWLRRRENVHKRRQKPLQSPDATQLVHRLGAGGTTPLRYAVQPARYRPAVRTAAPNDGKRMQVNEVARTAAAGRFFDGLPAPG